MTSENKTPAAQRFSLFIPEHHEGKQNDISHVVTLDTVEEAAKCFVRAYKRLFNPKIWHQVGGALSAEVSLRNANGSKERDLAEVNDHYRIDIPGPGTRVGDGYDWVVVEAIEDHHDASAAEEWMGLRLRPCRNPETNEGDIAHFFQDKATSTFIIHRQGTSVTASYHGRNEVPNTHTASGIDNLRNRVVTSGAMSGLSEAQWSALMKGFLQEEIGG
ncbi:MAG: hypothetical protein JNL72_02945 [Flavipsychrobacter sp.]|nr:hypothetical protein [Flavipsychrobacter sp.]